MATFNKYITVTLEINKNLDLVTIPPPILSITNEKTTVNGLFED